MKRGENQTVETSMWARVIKQHRIIRQETEPCAHDGGQEALEAMCYRMDLPKPIWLPKHQREWDEFNQTRFTQEHFVEAVPFDRLEIEYINPRAPKRRDPRNEF